MVINRQRLILCFFVKDAVFFSDICFNVDDATYAVAPT